MSNTGKMPTINNGRFAAAASTAHETHAAYVDDSLREIAIDYAAPILCAYVWWTLHQAQQQGIRKLWFCARDGQILKRIADQLIPKIDAELETGYLYAGRQVVHLPALTAIDKQAMAWMTGGCGVITLEALLERVGLHTSAIQTEVESVQIPTVGPIGWANADGVAKLFSMARVQELVLAQAMHRRNITLEYFKHCGLVHGEPCAIIDVGWRGSILRSLFNLIGEENGKRHTFLYFGLYGRPLDLPQARMQSFAFDHSTTPHIGECGNVPALTSLIEIFCMADHAPAMEIMETPTGPAARLRPGNAHVQPDWNISHFQDCVATFAGHLDLDGAQCIQSELVQICTVLLHQLAARPSRQQAKLLGMVLFHDDQAGSTAQRFAAPYTVADLRAAFRKGALPEKALAWWKEGAYTLTPSFIQCLLLAAMKLGNLRNQH